MSWETQQKHLTKKYKIVIAHVLVMVALEKHADAFAPTAS